MLTNSAATYPQRVPKDGTSQRRGRQRELAKRVHVVDDHPAVALALKVVFRMDGRFEIARTAQTAAAGLEFPPETADAVLLDLHLPDMSGLPLVQAFRDHDPTVPLILHSAADETPEVGAVRHLVDAVVLKSRVDELLTTLARVTDA
jgi:DNA-binding NarL/FixJ family response regulator